MRRRQKGGEAGLSQLAVRFLIAIASAYLVLFTVETWIELSYARVSFREVFHDPEAVKQVAGTVSRAINNLAAMVLTFLALAIPITANLYTPRLIEIFVHDRINQAALFYFALMGGHAIFFHAGASTKWHPTIVASIGTASGIVGFAILVPYYLYVLHYLDPTTVIIKVRQRIERRFERLVASKHPPTPEDRRVVEERILELGNVILRAIDRNDRDVTLEAVGALREVVFRYDDLKRRVPDSWFQVERSLFVGLSEEAVSYIVRDRVWVEYKCLSQLALAYNASLTKMRDAISAISDVNREIAIHAVEIGDTPLLELATRFFNTFIREAVKKQDVHAIYDTLGQYRYMARQLLPAHARQVRDIGRYIKYYADFARLQKLSFIYELAAYDLAAIVELAFEHNVGMADELLDTLLSFELEDASPRLAKASILVGAHLQSLGFEAQAQRVRDHLRDTPEAILKLARRDLCGTRDPVFWEVTDRQTNLDYIDPDRRREVSRFVKSCAGRRPDPAERTEAAPTRRPPVKKTGSYRIPGISLGRDIGDSESASHDAEEPVRDGEGAG